MNLAFILKALGVKVSPEQVAAIEALIPQIPGKIQQTIEVINAALQNFDHRLMVLETEIKWLKQTGETDRVMLARILEVCHGRDDSEGDYSSTEIGATERNRNANLPGNGNESR